MLRLFFCTFLLNNLRISKKKCTFAAILKKEVIMEVTTRTLQVTLPAGDAPFLRRLSGNMGWQVKTQRKSRNYYESPAFYRDLRKAEQDIANGKGLRVDSKDALDALFT